MGNLRLTETEGDVKFYLDTKGKLFQQIGNDKVFRVKNGKIAFIKIKQVGGNIIKYNTNGCYGFSIWMNGLCMEDGIWDIEQAESIAKELK